MKTKSFFLNLNVYEVIYDLIILLYVIIIYKIFAKDTFLISRMNEIQLAIFILMIDIAVPFYLGKIYKNYQKIINNQLILRFIVVLFTFITFWLFFVIPITLYNNEYIQSEYVIGIILGGGVINIITGYLMTSVGRSALIIPIVIGISLIILYTSLWLGINLFGEKYGVIIGFLFLFPLIMLLLGIIGSVFYNLIKKLKLKKNLIGNKWIIISKIFLQ